MTSWILTKKRKSEKDSGRATLASVMKEMARPRFAESAREEEEANHRVESSGSRGRGLEMKSKNPRILLCRALVSSIAVLTIGFLGLGVRAFASADTTKFIFVVAFVISAVVPVLCFTLRRSTRELTAHSLFREPSFVKRSLFGRLSAWRPRGGHQWILSAGPILSLVWRNGFLSRKSHMRLGERMSAEDRVVRVSKLPISRRAA